MKIVLILIAVTFLNQNIFATGDLSENPYRSAPSSRNESGSTFQAAIGKDDQPQFCAKCEENKKARLSNAVGVLSTAPDAAVSNPGEHVKSGK